MLWSVALAAGAATLTPVASAATDGPERRGTRVLAAGDFSTGHEGWAGYRSRLELVADGRKGGALRVSPLSHRRRFFAFRAPRPVLTTQRGATYIAQAWVRAPRRGSRVCLRVQHVAGGRLLRTQRRCVRAGTGWRLLGRVRLRAGCSGGQLGLAFVSSRGRTFDVDSVALAVRQASKRPAARACTRAKTGQRKPPPKPKPTDPAPAPTPTEPAPVPTAPTPTEPAPTEPAPAPAPAPSEPAPAPTQPPPVTSPVQPRSFLNPFPEGSIWNTALPAAPNVDPESAAKVAYWLTQIRNPLLGLRAFQTAIAVAAPDSPKHTISCTIYACPNMNQFGPVPIPTGTRADPSSDGHLAVWDPATNREWDFWVSQCPSSCALTGSGGSFSTDTLTPTVPYGGNAAHIPLLAGIVHPEEIKAGHIPHPLVFSSPNVAKGHVCPATHDDGDNLDARALREGTLLQLDPSVDVGALAIPEWQKTLARAMQQYGMYLVDGAGTLEIGGENPINRGDLWAEVGLMGDAAFFSSTFPWGKMRVLQPRAPWCA